MTKNLSFHGFIVLLASTMMMHAAGPVVKEIKWGTVLVEDPDGTMQKYKDCILFPSGSKNWDWKATGTLHVPGIQIADLKTKVNRMKLFIDAVDIVILSSGMQNVLQVMDETIAYLKEQGKEYYIKQTQDAVKLYNELAEQGKKVGALIHSTC